MERFRKLAWPLVLMLCAVFLVTVVGCKTTKVEKEYDSSPLEPEPEPEPGPEGPAPPT